jgi:signal transduction histidine kinase
LQQVLMNLGVNAAHAIGALPGRITLRVRSAEIGGAENPAGGSGTYACLEVADTGCGMDEATQARIFDPFFTTKLGQGGSGLGLNIVYNIVTQTLGGRVRVESEVGKGSRFVLDLPLQAPIGVEPGLAARA